MNRVIVDPSLNHMQAIVPMGSDSRHIVDQFHHIYRSVQRFSSFQQSQSVHQSNNQQVKDKKTHHDMRFVCC